MRIEVPIGDVADRITILEIKSRLLTAPVVQAHVRAELDSLTSAWASQCETAMDQLPGIDRLRQVNRELWEVEDRLRLLERARHFNKDFVDTARRVYVLNDERAELKRQISVATGSRLVEQKSYA